MRLAPALLLTTVLSTGAHAADYLRGPISSEPPRAAPAGTGGPYDWSGFYLGAHGMYSYSTIDLNRLSGVASNLYASDSNLAPITQQVVSFSQRDVSNKGWGGYFGYNTMWDDVVLGIEGEYSFLGAKSDSYIPTFGSTASYSATTTAIFNGGAYAKVGLTNALIAKARVGYAMDRLLIFGSLGIAHLTLKQSIGHTGTIAQYASLPPNGLVSTTSAGAAINTSSFKVGYALGAGAEYAVLDNVILRGDWQYVTAGAPATTNTTATAKPGNFSVNSLRVGANVKF